MSSRTNISWTDATWNPVTGCGPEFQCYERCYARRMATRLRGRCGYPADEPFRVTLHPERLGEPLLWKKPRRVFVVSMGDLFHEDVPDDYIDQMVAVMARAKQHTFQVLTKRPERMAAYFSDPESLMPRVQKYYDARAHHAVFVKRGLGKPGVGFTHLRLGPAFPLPNVWLGVSVENQAAADVRIPLLLKMPASVRFLSCEPLLGPVDLSQFMWNEREAVRQAMNGPMACNRDQAESESENLLHWVIAGGESGPHARPAHPDWFRSLRDQCQSAGAQFFLKQIGEWAPMDIHDPILLKAGPLRTWYNGQWADDQPDQQLRYLMAGMTVVQRVGKTAAGNLLDGREHQDFPGNAHQTTP